MNLKQIINNLFAASVYILSDKVWFTLFEICICLLTIYAILKVTIFSENSFVSFVERGKESQDFFIKTVGGISTLFLTIVFSLTKFPESGLLIFYLHNIFCILYLCLWNGWSTNKLIGLKNKLKTHNFNPHRQ
jgi:hypothetical protein